MLQTELILVGHMKPYDVKLIGRVSVPIIIKEDKYEDYEGPYEYDPLTTTQILQTEDKHTTQNIVFNMIQTRETPLSTGGVQFDILG